MSRRPYDHATRWEMENPRDFVWLLMTLAAYASLWGARIGERNKK